MHIGDSTHYLLTLAERDKVGGAALRVAVTRMLDEKDYDGIEVMALHGRVAELERRLDTILGTDNR